jgi:hypothetical protein
MYTEGNQNYPNAKLNNSAWVGQYDYVQSMNTTIDPLVKNLKTITDTDNSWFTRISVGIVSIPLACILLPSAVFNGFQMGGQISVGLLAILAIPGYIILLITVYMLLFIIFKLVEFFQRVPV